MQDTQTVASYWEAAEGSGRDVPTGKACKEGGGGRGGGPARIPELNPLA